MLRHDVESVAGLRRIAELLELERSYGFRSAFFFVPEEYRLVDDLRQDIARAGCEVGIHGLRHDGSLYESRSRFHLQADRIKYYLRAWDVHGFASPSSHHRLNWLHETRHRNTTPSTFDTDPFEPQTDNLDTIFPMEIHDAKSGSTLVELPYTLPQDFTLFVLLGEENSEHLEKEGRLDRGKWWNRSGEYTPRLYAFPWKTDQKLLLSLQPL